MSVIEHVFSGSTFRYLSFSMQFHSLLSLFYAVKVLPNNRFHSWNHI